MRRDQLEHIIRAAADVTKQKDLIIIGSQAILGQYPNAPESLERDKDLRYTGDLWRYGMLDPDTLRQRLRNTELKPTDKPRAWIADTIAKQQRVTSVRP